MYSEALGDRLQITFLLEVKKSIARMNLLITDSQTVESFFTLLRALFCLGVLHWKNDFFGVLQGLIT